MSHFPVVPCTIPIPGGLFEGRKIQITGIVDNKAKSFNIMLKVGCKDGDEVALLVHFNLADRHMIMNSWRDGWGREERLDYHPFREGVAFETIIQCGSKGYEISVNGHQLHSFAYRRTALQAVAYMDIEGDVSVTNVTFTGNPLAVDASCCREEPSTAPKKECKKKAKKPKEEPEPGQSTAPETSTDYQPSVENYEPPAAKAEAAPDTVPVKVPLPPQPVESKPLIIRDIPETPEPTAPVVEQPLPEPEPVIPEPEPVIPEPEPVIPEPEPVPVPTRQPAYIEEMRHRLVRDDASTQNVKKKCCIVS